MPPKASQHNGQPEAANSPGAQAESELSSAYAALLEDNAAFRSRLEREHTRVIEAEKATLAQTLLEAIDDLERALKAVTDANITKNRALGDLTKGVRLSLAALDKRVADMGAVRISTIGLRFDPAFAEAVDIVSISDPDRDGVIIDELRPGYRVGTRVLRPAQVRVGQLPRR
jgi:molecular chaperone GrpE